MPPRKPSTPATEEELSVRELVSEIRDLSKRLEDANGYMQIIADNIEGIKSEISWLLDNREHILPLILKSMPADPCQKTFPINQAPETPETAPDVPTPTPRVKKGPRTSLFPEA